MWVVAKIKKKELENFKKNLNKESKSKIKYYYPKIEYYKYFKNGLKKYENFILEDYIFCFDNRFRESSFLNRIYATY